MINLYRYDKICLDDPVEKIAQATFETFYQIPYLDQEARSINRFFHGALHVAMCTLLAELLIELYKKYKPELIEEFTKPDNELKKNEALTKRISVQEFQRIKITLIKLLATFHDSANTSEVEANDDKHGENYKNCMRIILKNYLIKKGFDKDNLENTIEYRYLDDLIKKGTYAIQHKDGAREKNHLGFDNKKNILQRILSDADVWDIMRVKKDQFDKNFLDIIQILRNNQRETKKDDENMTENEEALAHIDRLLEYHSYITRLLYSSENKCRIHENIENSNQVLNDLKHQLIIWRIERQAINQFVYHKIIVTKEFFHDYEKMYLKQNIDIIDLFDAHSYNNTKKCDEKYIVESIDNMNIDKKKVMQRYNDENMGVCIRMTRDFKYDVIKSNDNKRILKANKLWNDNDDVKQEIDEDSNGCSESEPDFNQLQDNMRDYLMSQKGDKQKTPVMLRSKPTLNIEDHEITFLVGSVAMPRIIQKGNPNHRIIIKVSDSNMIKITIKKSNDYIVMFDIGEDNLENLTAYINQLNEGKLPPAIQKEISEELLDINKKIPENPDSEYLKWIPVSFVVKSVNTKFFVPKGQDSLVAGVILDPMKMSFGGIYKRNIYSHRAAHEGLNYASIQELNHNQELSRDHKTKNLNSIEAVRKKFKEIHNKRDGLARDPSLHYYQHPFENHSELLTFVLGNNSLLGYVITDMSNIQALQTLVINMMKSGCVYSIYYYDTDNGFQLINFNELHHALCKKTISLQTKQKANKLQEYSKIEQKIDKDDCTPSSVFNMAKGKKISKDNPIKFKYIQQNKMDHSDVLNEVKQPVSNNKENSAVDSIAYGNDKGEQYKNFKNRQVIIHYNQWIAKKITTLLISDLAKDTPIFGFGIHIFDYEKFCSQKNIFDEIKQRTYPFVSVNKDCIKDGQQYEKILKSYFGHSTKNILSIDPKHDEYNALIKNIENPEQMVFFRFNCSSVFDGLHDQIKLNLLNNKRIISNSYCTIGQRLLDNYFKYDHEKEENINISYQDLMGMLKISAKYNLDVITNGLLKQYGHELKMSDLLELIYIALKQKSSETTISLLENIDRMKLNHENYNQLLLKMNEIVQTEKGQNKGVLQWIKYKVAFLRNEKTLYSLPVTNQTGTDVNQNNHVQPSKIAKNSASMFDLPKSNNLNVPRPTRPNRKRFNEINAHLFSKIVQIPNCNENKIMVKEWGETEWSYPYIRFYFPQSDKTTFFNLDNYLNALESKNILDANDFGSFHGNERFQYKTILIYPTGTAKLMQMVSDSKNNQNWTHLDNVCYGQ